MMVKKVIGSVLLAGLMGMLVYGAVNRTLAKSNPSEEFVTGTNWLDTITGKDQAAFEENHEQAGGYGRQIRVDENVFNGDGRGNAYRQGQALATRDMLTLEGVVKSVSVDTLTINIEDGYQWEIGGRAWWFAQESGFSAKAGDKLNLTGFYGTEDHFETARLENPSVVR